MPKLKKQLTPEDRKAISDALRQLEAAWDAYLRRAGLAK